MMTDERYTPVATAIAASLCWLWRWNDGMGTRAAVGRDTADQVGFWHRDNCRFCSTELSELLRIADLNGCDPEQLRWWNSLERKARAAKVYEAQEADWWDQM